MYMASLRPESDQALDQARDHQPMLHRNTGSQSVQRGGTAEEKTATTTEDITEIEGARARDQDRDPSPSLVVPDHPPQPLHHQNPQNSTTNPI